MLQAYSIAATVLDNECWEVFLLHRWLFLAVHGQLVPLLRRLMLLVPHVGEKADILSVLLLMVVDSDRGGLGRLIKNKRYNQEDIQVHDERHCVHDEQVPEDIVRLRTKVDDEEGALGDPGGRPSNQADNLEQYGLYVQISLQLRRFSNDRDEHVESHGDEARHDKNHDGDDDVAKRVHDLTHLLAHAFVLRADALEHLARDEQRKDEPTVDEAGALAPVQAE